MMKDKQLGAIIGEALKANPSSTKVDIQPIMKAITKLERKIRRERRKDSDHNKKTTKLCAKTDKELAGVMAKAEETQKQMNIRQAQLRNLRRTAKISLHASISMERKIEQILHAVRTEKRISLEKYYVRRTKRRKDITVLHSAVSLVCTFKSFVDDTRCKDHKVTFAVKNPAKTSLFVDKSIQLLTEEHDKYIKDQAAAWKTQIGKDLADLRAGKKPNYIHGTTSMIELAKSSRHIREHVRLLLGEGPSETAASSTQAMLLAIDAGEYEKAVTLLQLVLNIIKQLETKQKNDKKKNDAQQREANRRIIQQEHARIQEQLKQRQLKIDITSYTVGIEKARIEFFQAVAEGEAAQKSRAQNAKVCETERRQYRARKRVRDEELMNINKLRSLLRVLDGSSAAPKCDGDKKKCTAAAQGMCIYKDAKNSVCACEPGFYGEACQHRMCPGRGKMLYRPDESGACYGSNHGTCDKVSGKCTCNSKHFHGKKQACEFVKYCPGGGNCSNGRGKCDKETGKCHCKDQFFGLGCEKKKCPGAGAVDSLRFTTKDVEVCSGHGVCRTSAGKCACHETYKGKKCTLRKCPLNCTSRGSCNTQTGKCICRSGYRGAACQYKTCPGDCGGGVGGVCDRGSGKCVCNKGYSGSECRRSTACDVKDTTFRDWSMFRKGWSKCPYGWLMTGLKRGACSGVHCLDHARCARPCWGDQRLELAHCYQANWWSSLDQRGEGKCEDGYYLAGLYKNKCNSLYCIEMGYCCSIRNAGWDSCHQKDWYNQIKQDNTWATVPQNHFITFVGRRGLTASLDDLRDVGYCGFKRTDG